MICYLRYISNVSTMSCLRLRSKTLNYDVLHHSTPDCQFHLRWINFLEVLLGSHCCPASLGFGPARNPVFDIFSLSSAAAFLLLVLPCCRFNLVVANLAAQCFFQNAQIGLSDR